MQRFKILLIVCVCEGVCVSQKEDKSSVTSDHEIKRLSTPNNREREKAQVCLCGESHDAHDWN